MMIDDTPATDAVQPTRRQRILLVAFTAFSLIAFVVAIAMFVSSQVAERLLPYYGWPIIGFFYLTTMKFAIPPLVARNRVPIDACIRAISSTLRILVCFGIATGVIGLLTDDFGNPWLTVDVTQPIWTVLVPLMWIAWFRVSSDSATRQSVTLSRQDLT